MALNSPIYNPPAPGAPDPLTFGFGNGWTPDTPDLNNPGSPVATNVVPRTAISYGPVPQAQVYGTGSLSLSCQGAVSVLDNSGNVQVFAGDAHDLYLYSSGATTPAVVSKSSGAYNCPVNQFWRFEYYNNVVIATDGVDNVQSYTLGTSTTFQDMAGGVCPIGKYVTIAKNFLIFADTTDTIVNNPTSETNHQRVWWGPLGNPFSAWPTPGSASAYAVQSSYDDVFGNHGWCQGVVGNLGNADAAVFMEHAVFRMIFAGPPDTFDFQPVQAAKGTPAPLSIVRVGGIVFYLGEDGFYSFDGLNAEPIGVDMVDRWFWSNVNQSLLRNIFGASDPINKVVYWAFAALGESKNSHILAYNYVHQAWSKIDIQSEVLVQLLTFGYTLDEIYSTFAYTLDTMPYNLDSRVWTGGLLSFGIFNTSNQLAFFTGPNMAATVDSPERQFFPGQRGRITAVRPLIDGGTPYISVGTRERQIDSVVYKSAVKINSLGTCPQLTTGRYQRVRIITQAGDTWTNLYGAEVDADGAGPQ